MTRLECIRNGRDLTRPILVWACISPQLLPQNTKQKLEFPYRLSGLTLQAATFPGGCRPLGELRTKAAIRTGEMTHDDCELLERIVYIHFELGASARLLGKVTEAEEAYQTAIRFGQNAIRSGVAS